MDYYRVINNDILPAPLLRERWQEQEELLKAAEQVLPHIYRLLQGQNYMVILCDSEGYILKAVGDPPFLNKAQKVYLSPGANWREDIKGTNAIGTSISEGTAVKVLGWEHYVQENHFLNCWAAPVYNPEGKIAGVLDISGENGSGNYRLLEIALMGAKIIEQNLLLQELQKKVTISQQGFLMLGKMLQEGVIVIDNQGIITEINQKGARILGKRREEVIGNLISDVFSKAKSFSFSPKEGKFQIDAGLREKIGANLFDTVKVPKLAGQNVTEQHRWVGSSTKSKQVLEIVAKAAAVNLSVLLQGESGTGKEVIARYIHQLSERRDGPFIALNCAALPPNLIESELFGYVEGAFTGAKKGGQPGKFELANGGTIFLDEISDMPLNVQAALLRVLQEREVCRIGDNKVRKIDVRVIAATQRDLQQLVNNGLFRLDLYYRLKVITINLPPLRERKEDLYELVPYFVYKACQSMGKPLLSVDQEIYSYFLAYHWPGNVRELENCIYSMVALATGPQLTVADLPLELRQKLESVQADSGSLLEQKTKLAILEALKQTNGKIAPAARLLGMGRTTLYRKLKKYDLLK
ncbi:sigma-54-dependent Fis family transcriptional regulator [Carboxydothermus islandicus]|uniref:Sigma-54-dependent Fis family transcriptional regulator n=1 Tax=Carboxydothermus islandicus TaxID=661089 RepID=A0A1L8D187_9THEO|nr:sigma-54-dependent Fis family transcriptional regulator [Carboxydothermus islandicus]